jgi:hypothetical protein
MFLFSGIFTRQYRFFLLSVFLCMAGRSAAQMERTLYQVLEVDSIKTISLDLYGQYSLTAWAGSSMLIETNIQLTNASPAIMNYLIKQGRYDFTIDTISETELKIYTKDQNRKKIKTPAGECTEIFITKILVPDYMIWSDDRKKIARKETDK